MAFFLAIIFLLLLLASEQLQKRRSCSCNFYFEVGTAIFVEDENGFEEIKVNLVDIKLSKSYQEIAADNAKALFDELNITSDEYAHMVAVQSQEMIALQDKIMKLEESVRLQKIEIKSLKTENENLRIELEGDIDGNNHNK